MDTPFTGHVPNTIHLGGPILYVEKPCAADVTPGMLVDFVKNGGALRAIPNASATEMPTVCVALEMNMLAGTDGVNAVDMVYHANDLGRFGYLQVGSTYWGLVPSGQDISVGEIMQSAGGGYVKSATNTTAAANVARFRSLDELGAVNALTRCRLEVISL